MKKKTGFLPALLATVLLCACAGTPGADDLSGITLPTPMEDTSGAPFMVTSSAVVFEALDAAYGIRGGTDADGQPAAPVTSLPLQFVNAPEGTQCFALIMEDPDSVPVVGYVCDHWLAANIENSTLEAGASLAQAGEMVQGMNYQNTVGYLGPAPPEGTAHSYVITVWALDAELELDNGFTRGALEAAMEGHILGSAEMTATYSNY